MQPLAQNWNQSTILEEGLSFLLKKKEELDTASSLWEASYNETSFYETESQAAANRYKEIATKNLLEIGLFHLAVKESIEANLANPSLSAEIDAKLAHLLLVSRYAVDYFGSALKDTQYPDTKERNFRITSTISGTMMVFAPTITAIFNSCSGDRCSALRLFGPTLLCMGTWLVSGILGMPSSNERRLKKRKVLLETALGQRTQNLLVHRKPSLDYGIHPFVLGAGLASLAIVLDIKNKNYR